MGVASACCALVVLSACGQKGNLYLPNDPEFQQRATLPEIVRRQLPGANVAPPASSAITPASGTLPAAATSPATPASAVRR